MNDRHEGASHARKYPSSGNSREAGKDEVGGSALAVVDAAPVPSRVGDAIQRSLPSYERAAFSLGVFVLVGPPAAAARPVTRSVPSRVRRLTATVGRMNELLELRSPGAREALLEALDDLLDEAEDLASDLMDGDTR